MDAPPKPLVRSLVPFAHVANVPASIAFYEKLGFEVRNTFVPAGESDPAWAWLESDRARLMLGTADPPVTAGLQGVLFYLYCDDVPAARAAFERAGVAVGDISYPFYCPRGEFRVQDPDGYVLMVAHT